MVISFLSLNAFANYSIEPAHSYYPKSFMNILSTKSDQHLIQEIFLVLSSKHQRTKDRDLLVDLCPDEADCYLQRPLDYREARSYMFGQLHLQSDKQGEYVKDVYCQKIIRGEQVGKMKIPQAGIVNCEHTWPQSRFNKSFAYKFQKGDLHHLFPTDSKANSARGNHPFATVTGKGVVGNCDASSKGTPIEHSKRGRHGVYFEVPDMHKGNAARALFYFSVRYKLKIDTVQEYYLKQWHRMDPVDEDERIRNQGVFLIQNNRNPFVDFPSMVDHISDF